MRLSLALLFLPVLAASAQDAGGDETYWPLAEGAEWRFKGRPDDQEVELVWKMTRSKGTRKYQGDCWKLEWQSLEESGKGKRVIQVTTIYLLQKKEGLAIVDWERAGGDDFGYLLKYPLRNGTVWESQMFGGPKMSIVEELQGVTTPAGSFRCKQVEFVNAYPDSTFKTRWWLASGTGMVKVERSTWKADKLTELQVWELTKYVPGKAP